MNKIISLSTVKTFKLLNNFGNLYVTLFVYVMFMCTIYIIMFIDFLIINEQ